MIFVDFDPERLAEQEQKDWWARWSERAARASARIVERWEAGDHDPPFDTEVWRDLKGWLLKNVFHNKCAYCETPIVRFSVHAEHYRPKGRVTPRAITEDAHAHAIEHPGYFWLAYDWKNLLPSCEFCNTAGGKGDKFPVRIGHGYLQPLARLSPDERNRARRSGKWQHTYYPQPDELDRIEDPDLLHPYRDRPQEVLLFGEGGVVSSADPKGRQSICIYRLDDPGLTSARQREQERAWETYVLAWRVPGSLDKKRAAAAEALQSWRNGEAPYSAAALDYVDLMRKQIGAP